LFGKRVLLLLIKPLRRGMMQNLIITLDEKTTQKYLELIGGKTESEVNTGCMPSGGTISIDIIPPFGTIVYLDNIEIGEAQIDWVEN